MATGLCLCLCQKKELTDRHTTRDNVPGTFPERRSHKLADWSSDDVYEEVALLVKVDRIGRSRNDRGFVRVTLPGPLHNPSIYNDFQQGPPEFSGFPGKFVKK